jgi:hypothetical protein
VKYLIIFKNKKFEELKKVDGNDKNYYIKNYFKNSDYKIMSSENNHIKIINKNIMKEDFEVDEFDFLFLNKDELIELAKNSQDEFDFIYNQIIMNNKLLNIFKLSQNEINYIFKFLNEFELLI